LHAQTLDQISVAVKPQISEAVDSGIDRLVLDLTQIKDMDADLVNLGIYIIDSCHEFSIKYHLVGSSDIAAKYNQFEETKDWQFVPSIEEALSSLKGAATAA